MRSQAISKCDRIIPPTFRAGERRKVCLYPACVQTQLDSSTPFSAPCLDQASCLTSRTSGNVSFLCAALKNPGELSGRPYQSDAASESSLPYSSKASLPVY